MMIYNTLMAFTKLAVLLATSLADCTKCLLATGLFVLDEAKRHVLQRDDVCLATIVAADSTYKYKVDTSMLYQTLVVNAGVYVKTLHKTRL